MRIGVVMKYRRCAFLLFLLLSSGMLIVPAGQAAEKIGAIGRIRPAAGIVKLVGAHGATIAEVLVREGDTVTKGQPLVVFETRGAYQLELELAQLAAREADELGARMIELQQMRLREIEQLSSRATGVQIHKIKAAEVESGFASRRLGRFQKLEKDRVSELQMDERQSQADIAAAKLLAARQELEHMKMERDLKLHRAGAELERLRLNRELQVQRTRRQQALTKERLRLSVLTAPGEGSILEVRQAVGEMVAGHPVLLMADFRRMDVVAEVFEGDLLKLKPGMKASITSASLPQALDGEIHSIGRLINPAARTANVVIRLADAETAARLINMEVDVTIRP